MKKLLLPIILMTILLTACGAIQTPLPTLVPVSPTSTLPAPTQTNLPTVTLIPTIEVIPPTETPASQNTSSTVSFANQILPILQTYCIECHGGQRTREGLSMTTYHNLIAGSLNGAVLIPGNANDSLFVQLIANGEMPNRGAPPTAEELQLIIDWINQGALNN